jgi:hypothetical protein
VVVEPDLDVIMLPELSYVYVTGPGDVAVSFITVVLYPVQGVIQGVSRGSDLNKSYFG